MSEQELREQYPNFAALTDHLNTKKHPRKTLERFVVVLKIAKEREAK